MKTSSWVHSSLCWPVPARCRTDVSGKWASAPIYLILKQEGNKLSGSAGPTEKEQILTFEQRRGRGAIASRSRQARFSSA